MHYDLPISTKAMARIIRQAGLVRKKKKKWKKRQDLKKKKKALKALEFIEFDTKDLSDIEKYWPQMKKLELPRYEHTARDIRTGGTWFAYAKTWQSDVEAFHKLVEDEPYEIEEYKGLEEFKAKAYAYGLYFLDNFLRFSLTGE